jgi:hypothetical protein
MGETEFTLAKPIVVVLENFESTFSFVKLDRTKLYGTRRRIVLGPDDETCQRAQLTEDGSLLLRSGMTAQGYFDDSGDLISQSDFVGISSDGSIVPRQPSTLGVAQELSGPVGEEEVLNLELTTVYHATAVEIDSSLEIKLKKGEVFRFPLNYYADFQTETAYLLLNDEGYFVLVGVPTNPQWSESQVVPSEVFESEDLEGDDDLDFEMF